MKTVQDYLDLGLVFVSDDMIHEVTRKPSYGSARLAECLFKCGEYPSGIKLVGSMCGMGGWTPSSFAWRNNDGVKPEYNGAMEVELNSGDVIFNCGKTSEFDWRINDDVNPKILRWKPVVISDGIAGCGYRFAINECQKTSLLQHKPKINLIVPDSLKAEVRRVGGEINVTISQKDKQENAANNLEKVISIDAVCDAIKKVSPKEDKPMKPVYTAEMHAKNELPPVGAECEALCMDAMNSKHVWTKAKILMHHDGNECAVYCIDAGVLRWADEFKPIAKTIKVNCFDVPAPMSEAPEHRQMVYLASSAHIDFNLDLTWQDDDSSVRWLSRGLIHSTKSAAIAHAKAMLGIDPNA